MKVALSAILAFCLSGCQTTDAKNIELGAKERPEVVRAPASYRYDIADVADKVRPVVVSIQTETEFKQGFRHPLEEFFFGPGMREPSRPRVQQSLGSGVIVSDDGYILTNNHVVEGATSIKVRFFDEREFDAEIIGLDEKTDIAVVKIKEKVKDLPVAYLGDSEKIRVGERVVAIGSPFGLNHTVTTGIVSATNISGRGITSYENFIQTDAAINPGNSGGALVNLDGEVIGVNTAILSRSGGFNGIGFAIPMSMAKKVMKDLIEHGSVSRGWLGVVIQDIDATMAKSLGLKGTRGALISQVMSHTPAEKGGLQAGDVIREIDGKSIKDVNELRTQVAQIRPGTEAIFKVIREGKEKEFSITLASQSEGEISGDGTQWFKPLGMKLKRFENVKEKSQGFEVVEVKENSKAARAGLRSGDQILKVNGVDLQSFADLQKILKKKPEAVLLWLKRESGNYFVALELE